MYFIQPFHFETERFDCNYALVWFMVLNATFNNISVISWQSGNKPGGGNWNTLRKPLTCHIFFNHFTDINQN
jgi:hypothetical protein